MKIYQMSAKPGRPGLETLADLMMMISIKAWGNLVSTRVLEPKVDPEGQES